MRTSHSRRRRLTSAPLTPTPPEANPNGVSDEAVTGMSDHADEDKTDSAQELAARNSSAAAYDVATALLEEIRKPARADSP